MMHRNRVFACLMLPLLLTACKTVGASREKGGYAVLSPTVANEMIRDNQQVVIIDFRPASEYRGPAGHIAAALSIPLDAIERRLPELLPYVNTTILVYADNPDDARMGATLLSASGFRNVVMIRGGIREWIDLGYKTVASS